MYKLLYHVQLFLLVDKIFCKPFVTIFILDHVFLKIEPHQTLMKILCYHGYEVLSILRKIK